MSATADADGVDGDPGATPRFVHPGLAVGGIRCLDSLRSHGFTHVLSVLNVPVSLPEEAVEDEGGKGKGSGREQEEGEEGDEEKIRHARIDVADDERADLLSHLPFATRWVREALRGEGGGERGGEEEQLRSNKNKNKVLIHCSAGVSRSAAVAAACLMALSSSSSNKNNDDDEDDDVDDDDDDDDDDDASLSADAAVAAVAAAAPGTCPNRGFLEQLRLFREMGLRIDARSGGPAYRAWRSRAMAAAAMEGSGGRGANAAATAATGVEEETANAAAAAAVAAKEPLTTYRCRACRRLVATSENAVPATSETGGGPQKAFARKRWRHEKKEEKKEEGEGEREEGDGEQEDEEEEKERRQQQTAASSSSPPPLPLGSDGSSLFVEPLRWMLDALSLSEGGKGTGGRKKKSDGGDGGDGGDGDGGSNAGEEGKTVPPPTRGKLHCPGCSSRLGSFSWSGCQSATGAWVVPAFQLHLSRLDAAVEGGGGGSGGGGGGDVGGGGETASAATGAGQGKGASPPPSSSSPAVPASVASRIRQPRFLR